MTKNDLLELIPEFLRNIREIQAIFGVVAKKLTAYSEKTKQQIGDLFIESDDLTEIGVDRLAQSLKIDVVGLDFQDKVFKIKTALLDKRPYNDANIRSMLSSLCGENGYRIEINRADKSVVVGVDLGRKNQFNAVLDLLNNVIPSDMTITVELLYNLYGNLAVYTHGELSSKTHEHLRSEALS